MHKDRKMPNGTVVVFLEGLQRIRINELLSLRPFLRAAVASEPDFTGEKDAELEAYKRNSQDLFRDVVTLAATSDDLAKRGITSMIPAVSRTSSPEHCRPFDLAPSGALIETSNVRKRLEMSFRILQGT